MIAKHVRMGEPKAGRFSRLVHYLLDPQAKAERVCNVTVTNCYSNDIDRAVLEVLNTQAQNVRAKSDKTYHLVVSFAPGETPSEETIAAIEKSIVEGLGYEEHQRLSVVHHDTDCLHIHLAINKIHPRRHTIHDPPWHHLRLGSLCAQLEKIHGLQATNHQTQSQRLQQGAAEMETRSQRESFTSWVRRECAASLAGAASWEEWHKLAAGFGLITRKRGAGLVIESADADGVAAKASTIDRAFSLAALEKRFGAFVEPAGEGVTAERRYQGKPVQTDTTALYARYRHERTLHAATLSRHRERLRAAKRDAIEHAKRIHSGRRRRLRLLPRSLGKQLLYGQIARAHRRRLDGIFSQAKQAQRLMRQTHGGLSWADWLAREAANGDTQALLALRARTGTHEHQNSVSAVAPQSATQAPSAGPFVGVTKRGSIFLRPGIRDEGKRVSIQSNRETRDYVALLNLAMSRFGPRLRAEGDERFRTQIVLAAVVSRVDVTFEDVALESKRKHFVTVMETMNERKGDERRRKDRGGARPARDSRGRGSPGGFDGNRVPKAPDLASTLAGTHLDGARPIPTAQSLDGLRDLSTLPVVRGSEGTALLLPSDVHRHVAQRRAASADPLRRPPSSRALNERAADGWAQADRYIAERMEKRLSLSGIPKHQRHDQTGIYPFAGLRTVNGQGLALFKTECGVGVLPVSDYAVRRLKGIPLNKPVKVSANGVRLGRSR